MHEDRAIGSRVFQQPHEGLGAGVRHGEQAVQQLLMRSATRWVVGGEQQIVTALEIVGKGGVVLRVRSDGVRRSCCCCCCCVGRARCGTGSRWCCRHCSYKQTTDSCVGCCLRFFVCGQAGFFVQLGAVPSFSPIGTPMSSSSLSSTPASQAGSMESNKRCPWRSVIMRFWMLSDLPKASIVTIIVGVAGTTVTQGCVMTW